MNKPEPLRVLIADDHRIMLASLRSLLEARGFAVVGEAATGEEAVALAALLQPQVILMDLEMPGTGGLAAAHRIRKAVPTAKVVILSAHEEESEVLEAFTEAGVAGYLVKSDAPEELPAAIRAVSSGKRYLSPSITPIVLGQIGYGRSRKSAPGNPLTRREREVLRLIGLGSSSKDIAQALAISPKTAQVHRENIKRKLDLSSTADLIRYAIRRKIVKLE